MAIQYYNAGTASVVQGSTYVDFVDTYMVTAGVKIGALFFLQGGPAYVVAEVVTQTRVRLLWPYLGATAVAQPYVVTAASNDILTPELVDRTNRLLLAIEATKNTVLQGRFPDGTVVSPGISFAGELGTGWSRPSAGVLVGSVSETERARLTSTGLSVTGGVRATGAVTAATVALSGINGWSGPQYNYNYFSTGPATDQSYLLATLPASGAGTLDHVLIEGVLGDFFSDTKYSVKLVCGNRGGFSYQYLTGTQNGGQIRAYTQVDGSVNLYATFLAGSVSAASLNITAALGNELVVYPPGGAVVSPTGTLAFSTGTAVPGYKITHAGDFVVGGVLRPATSGTQTLGAPGALWDQLYASTNVISTSDATQKTVRGELSLSEIAVARAIVQNIVVYQWDSAIATKGADAARLHTGWTAQSVAAAFVAQGLDPTRYALFCQDEIEVDGQPTTRLGLRHDQLLAFVLAGTLAGTLAGAS